MLTTSAAYCGLDGDLINKTNEKNSLEDSFWNLLRLLLSRLQVNGCAIISAMIVMLVLIRSSYKLTATFRLFRCRIWVGAWAARARWLVEMNLRQAVLALGSHSWQWSWLHNLSSTVACIIVEWLERLWLRWLFLANRLENWFLKARHLDWIGTRGGDSFVAAADIFPLILAIAKIEGRSLRKGKMLKCKLWNERIFNYLMNCANGNSQDQITLDLHGWLNCVTRLSRNDEWWQVLINTTVL